MVCNATIQENSFTAGTEDITCVSHVYHMLGIPLGLVKDRIINIFTEYE